jgi:hypothetical protein
MVKFSVEDGKAHWMSGVLLIGKSYSSLSVVSALTAVTVIRRVRPHRTFVLELSGKCEDIARRAVGLQVREILDEQGHTRDDRS